MKQTAINKIILSGFILVTSLLSACSLFERDNFEAPDVTLEGEVVDVLSGERILTDQGGEGIRVRLTELSWGDNVEHNPDFFCKPDGTFLHTKLFAGHYNVTVDGPFIPLVRETSSGKLLADESKYLDLSGTNTVRFEVQPFLHVRWVGEPVIEEGKVSVQVRVERGVTKEDFRTKVEPLGDYNEDFVNITDVQLFVSYSSSVGYRARDERWSSKLEYEGSTFDPMLGETITLVSNGEIPAGRTVFVRAAARINYDTPRGTGTRRWNYNEAKVVVIP
ncbi:DUF3823 domain-containing protein [Sphingobacterium sp. JB170]|uniref:DUF3823 domain-containing protein n=1 Tax=Sphingobacterium sp. JB170 TaxID=1434842 RepID=UPI00097E8C5D|nr:DUF3823 domain-containing protein [Sphingobacterium sp. JB170]SJN48902.1 hypothetical protein FM107_17855 [Sphingobacterium sp. JB170]